jgi:hypothetical protein
MVTSKWVGWIAAAAILGGCAAVRPEAKESQKDSTPSGSAVDPAIRLEDYPTVTDKRNVGPFWLYIREPAKSENDGGFAPLWDALEIRRGESPEGKLVYLNLEAHASFGSDLVQIADWKGAPLVGIRTYSGGMHCCTGIVLLHLSDPVKVVTEIEFTDLDDSPYYVRQRGGEIVADLPVAWLRICPRSELSIPYTAPVAIWPGVFHLDTTGLQKHHEDVEKESESIRDAWEANAENPDENDCESPIPPTELWQTLYRLVYTGAGDDCWPLIERVWPEHYPGKKACWENTIHGLKTSPYWEDIRKLNKWK